MEDLLVSRSPAGIIENAYSSFIGIGTRCLNLIDRDIVSDNNQYNYNLQFTILDFRSKTVNCKF